MTAMASAKEQVVCHVCGFKNAPGTDRCVSCGAKLEELAAAYSVEEKQKKENQQDGFAITWALASFFVYMVLQAVFLIALPAVIPAYDPQGFSALMISIGMWCLGGFLIGFISPGRTFLEPSVGALLAVVPTIWWLATTTPSGPEHLGGGFALTMPAYVIGAIMGGMISLFGAFLGEKLQGATRGHRSR